MLATGEFAGSPGVIYFDFRDVGACFRADCGARAHNGSMHIVRVSTTHDNEIRMVACIKKTRVYLAIL
jgi:hypothetical protein